MLLVTLMRGISIQWKGQRADTSRLSDEQKLGKMTAIRRANSFKKLVVQERILSEKRNVYKDTRLSLWFPTKKALSRLLHYLFTLLSIVHRSEECDEISHHPCPS